MSLGLRRIEAGEAYQNGLEKAGKFGLGRVLRDAPKLTGDKVRGAVEETLKIGGRVIQKKVAGVGSVGEFDDSCPFAYETGDPESGLPPGLVRVHAEVNHLGPGNPGKVGFLE